LSPTDWGDIDLGDHGKITEHPLPIDGGHNRPVTSVRQLLGLRSSELILSFDHGPSWSILNQRDRLLFRLAQQD
jgi:hypothetical protein